MQTTTALITAPRRARSALGAVLIAASIALAGCSVTPVTTLPAPAEENPAETPTTSEGYVYEDAVSGYAVTFPGEPDVVPLVITGTDRIADMAGYGDISAETFYISRGEIRDEVLDAQDLMNELRAWAMSVGAETFSGGGIELGGLPAVTAEIIMPDGQEATTILTGEDERFYQLIVMGGTPELRQAFFDSFELLG